MTHMLHVTCHMSGCTIIFFYLDYLDFFVKLMDLVGGGSVINGATFSFFFSLFLHSGRVLHPMLPPFKIPTRAAIWEVEILGAVFWEV